MPGGSETILLVEDDDSVRTLTRQVLKRCGYEVLEGTYAFIQKPFRPFSLAQKVRNVLDATAAPPPLAAARDV